MHWYFACMYSACRGQHQIPLDQGYNWLWAIMWVPVIKLGPLEKQPVLVIAEPSIQTLIKIFI